MSSLEPIATEIILVRHGQSLANRDGSYAAADAGLTELGWRQALLVADWLARNLSADALVSSRLVRAVQTAEVIGQRIGLSVQVLPGFEEADQPYGNEFPSAADDPMRFWDNVWQPDAANAPRYTGFRARLQAAMSDLMRRYTGKTVIIVTHGGVIGTIVRSLFGGHLMPIFTETGGVTRLAWQEGRWRLISHNERGHLAESYAETASWPESSQTRAIMEHFDRVALSTLPRDDPTTDHAARALIALMSPSLTDVVLDLGTGTARLALVIAPHVARVSAIDISPAMLERAELARLVEGVPNVDVRWADAQALPYPASSYDIVMGDDLLHYIGDLAPLFGDLRRILKPDGRFVLDELVGSEDAVKRATHQAIEMRRSPAFVKLYSESEIEKQARKAGFRLEHAEAYETTIELADWLAPNTVDEAAATEVREMLLASPEVDATGLPVQISKAGEITFKQRRLRLLARSPAGQEP